ncbi:hypothetical protein K438DRAFT_316977 [Mycena galopus ATCC 62051]|nr:hypothetical protein K438DRAFT_316977 [Mycena galopus ATCC 62051]
MNYHKWPPGPLLTPPAFLDLAEALCSLECNCSWPSSERVDMELDVSIVSVLKDGIVLSNSARKPLLIKRYILMNSKQRFVTHRHSESTLVTLPARMNVIDDYDIDVAFKSVADLELFSAAVASCPDPNPQLWTNIYVLTNDSSDEDSDLSDDSNEHPSFLDSNNDSSDDSKTHPLFAHCETVGASSSAHRRQPSFNGPCLR